MESSVRGVKGPRLVIGRGPRHLPVPIGGGSVAPAQGSEQQPFRMNSANLTIDNRLLTSYCSYLYII